MWRTNVGSTAWSSPSVAGDQLFIGDGAGRLHIMDRQTGKDLALFRTGAGVFGSPVVSGALVIFGSNDGGVYALRLSNGLAIHRAVYLDSTYIRAELGGRSAEIATYAGGKIVWLGTPPLLWSVDTTGKFPGLNGFKWNAPSELLGLDAAAAIFDERSVRSTDDGLRWGFPRSWRASWGIAPAGVTTVLGKDSWCLAAGWVKSYGGSPGTGFVRVPGDDLLSIYIAAEYRPTTR